MSILQALVLGAVQGLTEFIPISSSGHLVLVPEALGWQEPGLAFDVLLHAASLLALLVYFSGDLLDLVRGTIQGNKESRRLAMLLAVGTVPAGAAGLVWGDFFEDQFSNASAAAIQLLVTAVILVAAERALAFHLRRTARRAQPLRGMQDLAAGDATTIGVAQAISILPGISRSGATIGAGLGLAMDRSAAARFAFLLAIPALAGAAIVKVPDLGGTSLGAGAGLAGFLASLITSYGAIWGLIKYLRTRSLYPFAAYCVVAGVLFYLVVN
ncbi:MAG: undecaprenyl-diphosphatase [Actinobacteria bacterium]|nr:undecaprenyl-diphosphatase [Actinomycetota bacterium]